MAFFDIFFRKKREENEKKNNNNKMVVRGRIRVMKTMTTIVIATTRICFGAPITILDVRVAFLHPLTCYRYVQPPRKRVLLALTMFQTKGPQLLIPWNKLYKQWLPLVGIIGGGGVCPVVTEHVALLCERALQFELTTLPVSSAAIEGSE